MLPGERYGGGPRVALLHGFGQTRRCWGPLAHDLARDHQLVALDAPGHGASAAITADLNATAGLVADAAGRATYVGYSMGARMALHVVLARPEAVRGLVLIGGTPGIEDERERAARRANDRRLAQRIREHGVEPFVTEWLAQPLFAGLPPEARFESERCSNSREGLARSLELAGTGSQRPLWDELARIDAPVLAVAGQMDDRYARIAERMAGAIGASATVALVPGAGHSAHLEQPDAFLTLLRPWLAAHDL